MMSEIISKLAFAHSAFQSLRPEVEAYFGSPPKQNPNFHSFLVYMDVKVLRNVFYINVVHGKTWLVLGTVIVHKF